MNVKKTTLTIAILSIFSTMMISCQSSQQLMNPSLSLQHIERIPYDTLDYLSIAEDPISLELIKNITPADPLQKKYAAILGVLPQTIRNIQLYNFIEEWYGVRYRFGGDNKKGIDCSAFVKRLYDNVFCIDLLRTSFQQFNMCKFLTKDDSLIEGDLVFFKTRGNRISHVGIYLMNDFFVHASSSRGVMISSLNNSYWSRRYAGAGTILNHSFANRM